MVLLTDSLSDRVFPLTLAVTWQVKMVSMVLRGERVREELVGEGELMEIRPSAEMDVLTLSSQVKENSKFLLSIISVSTSAEHVRVVSPSTPATRGPEGAERDTERT